MKIEIRNHIHLEGEVEIVELSHEVNVTEKNGHIYLLYRNEENEKVLIKANHQELLMTRFSAPKSIMRFVADKEVIVTIPTPLGVQHFITDTNHYLLDNEEQKIILFYSLKQMDSNRVFADYQMEISWK